MMQRLLTRLCANAVLIAENDKIRHVRENAGFHDAGNRDQFFVERCWVFYPAKGAINNKITAIGFDGRPVSRA